MRKIKDGFCGFGLMGDGQTQYVVKLGQIEARADGAQECWDMFLAGIKDAVSRGLVTKDYQFGQEIMLLYKSFDVLISMEKNKRIVREEKARSAMLDYATQEGYRA